MASLESGPSRAPLQTSVLLAETRRSGLPWAVPTVVASTGSTNADAAAAARGGAPEGWALLAGEQTAGRGRLARSWASPAGTSISLSVVLRPAVPSAVWGWLPLLTGLAVVDVARGYGVGAALKWPNDAVVPGAAGPRKLAGILLERVAGTDAVVVGVGVNIGQREDELAVSTATSVAIETGATPGREEFAAAILAGLHASYGRWCAAAGDARAAGLWAEYVAVSATVGQRVRVELGPDQAVVGLARAVDDLGRLVVATAAGERVFSSGDVVHVRPGDAP